MKKITTSFIITCFIFTGFLFTRPQTSPAPEITAADSDRLAILWTSGDPEVAKKMVFIYSYNAKKYNWYKTIRLIIWGPSAKLVKENREIRDWVSKLNKIGVELYSCKWCAEQYEASKILQKLGVKVIYYGKPLTKLVKDGWPILTF